MTANLKRFDPAGTDGATATPTGNLASVIVAGAGAVAYEADYGMSRGSNMGLRATSPGTSDQANIKVTTTAAAAGTGQVYGSFENWPTGGAQEFTTLRTSTLNCIRQLVSTAGSVTVQNQAGSTVATLGSISLNTIYRFELEATPGTTTSNGSGRARVYDDSDTLVYDSGPLTGNYGGGSGTKTVSEFRVGDPATATTSGFAFGFTQPAIDTDTTPPTIAPVSAATNYTSSPADSAGATDTASPVQDMVESLADAAGVTDLDGPQTIDYGPSSNDGGAASDSASIAAATARTAADGAGAIDSASAMADFARAIADAAGLSDSATAVLSWGVAPADSAGGTDQLVIVATAARLPADPAAGTDAATRVLDVSRTAADAAGGTDVATASLARVMVSADAAGGTDQVSVALTIERVVTDAAAATDVRTIVILLPMPAGTPSYRIVQARTSRRLVQGGGSRTVKAMKRRQ
ncbi:MAG: hypothetical protein IPJ61_21500 [Tessaracoccus sp.]|uniref:hypothetical protein n=1 Tax=Tessaracoccus sp. TaxID=1971211 RepID=UPI001EBA91AC|nr:hypothetical protein [Tessaracoccus sp.]MBK7823565.1 hypothetical protein [Tessaracoccus sp.]